MKKAIWECVQWVGVFVCLTHLMNKALDLFGAPVWLMLFCGLLLGWYYPRLFPIHRKIKKGE